MWGAGKPRALSDHHESTVVGGPFGFLGRLVDLCGLNDDCLCCEWHEPCPSWSGLDLDDRFGANVWVSLLPDSGYLGGWLNHLGSMVTRMSAEVENYMNAVERGLLFQLSSLSGCSFALSRPHSFRL